MIAPRAIRFSGSLMTTLAKIGAAVAGLKATADIVREPQGLPLLYAPASFLGFTFGVGGAVALDTYHYRAPEYASHHAIS